MEQTELEKEALIIEQDNEIIENVYKMIKDAALKVGKTSNKVYSAMEYCTSEDFSVRGITYEEAVENCSNCFQYSAKNIREYAELLMEALRTNMEEIEEELEEEVIECGKKEESKILYRTTSEDINITIPEGGI